jgi:hypothetical protein
MADGQPVASSLFFQKEFDMRSLFGRIGICILLFTLAALVLLTATRKAASRNISPSAARKLCPHPARLSKTPPSSWLVA